MRRGRTNRAAALRPGACTPAPARDGVPRRRPSGLRVCGATVALAAGLVSCAPSQAPATGLLLITVDTLRADRVGIYGGAVPTPNIDSLARRGAWFPRARTVVPLTLPAHASILTGLHPLQHFVHNNGTFRLQEERTTLAEILRARGWRTGAIVGSFVLDAQFGLAQGFEQYDGPLSSLRAAGDLEPAERDAARVTEASLAWLARADGRPFFLWVHYYDPHAPYAPPEPFRSRHAGTPYDGEVEYVDREIGRLLDAVAASPRGEATLVAMVGDHGESLGEHGETTHGLFLYEAVLRVPMLLAGPGVGRPGAVQTLATTLDLVPTLLNLLRLESPPDLPGRDLLGPHAGRGGQGGGRSAAVHPAPAETRLPCLNFGWSGSEAIVDGDLKLILGAAPELFDLAADPAEEQDLGAQRPAERERLENRLAAVRSELSPVPVGEALPGETAFAPDPETRARLASLGYLHGGSGPGDGCRSGADPRRRLPVLQTIDRGVAEYQAGRHAAAAGAFDEAVRLDPGNLQAHFYLATTLKKLGRQREAADRFAAASALDPDNLTFLHEEAGAWFDLGEFGRAEARLQEALRRHPGVSKTHFFLGRLQLARGRAQAALAEYDAARSGSPPSADLEFERGRALVALGRRGEALESLRAACALAPQRSEWHGTLAGLLAAEGRPAEAAVLLRDLLLRRPEDPLALYNLAVLVEASGDPAEALLLYRRAARAWSGDPRRLESIRARIRGLEATPQR